MNLTIGALTPPVGTYLYIMAKVADMTLESVIKAVIPWIVPLLIVLLLITVFPDLVLWLPRVLGMVG